MMKKGIAQFTAFCMAAGMTFTGNGMVSLAAGTDMALVGIGSTTKVNNDTVSDETTASGETADETLESSEAAWEPLDTSMVDTMGISQCEEYINIRSSADTEGEILGKLYNNSAVYIEGVDENGWYKVKSGNVEGYVAVVKKGTIMFEVAGVSKEVAREAFRLAANKLPITAKLVAKESE